MNEFEIDKRQVRRAFSRAAKNYDATAVMQREVCTRLLEKLDPEAVGLFVSNVPVFQQGGYMKELMVETLTKERFSRFMSLSNLRLQLELLRVRWVQKRNK